MPAKFKFTREEIIAAALELTRRGGMEALTARGLAAELGTSAKPIFGQFHNMEEVQRCVMEAAHQRYQACLRQTVEEGKYPPYKATGMGYIHFAREEKELFRLLFMRDRFGEPQEGTEELRPILEIVMKNLGLTEEQALLFHLEQWVYVHGIATMIVTGYLDWDMDLVSCALTDVYMGLKYRFTGK